MNFELGVLFHSKPGKEYRALNPLCPTHSTPFTNYKDINKTEIGERKEATNITANKFNEKIGYNADEDGRGSRDNGMIILPFPFDLRGGKPYYEEDEGRFKHRPFINGSVKEVRIRILLELLRHRDYRFECIQMMYWIDLCFRLDI